MAITKAGKNERLRVMNGTLKQTSGGLRKKDLKKNKYGRIVSKKASAAAKKRMKMKKYAHVRKIFRANKF